MEEIVKKETQEEKTYKIPLGQRFKKVIRTLTSLGIATVLAIGATTFVACGNKNPDDQVGGDKPNSDQSINPPTGKTELEKANEDYALLVSTIGEANSLTTKIQTTNGGIKILEIQDNKLKSTKDQISSYVETKDDQTFEYNFTENEWHKTISTQMTPSQVKTTHDEMLESANWTTIN